MSEQQQDASVIRLLSSEDLSQITSVHCRAFPDSAMTKLGVGVVRRYYDWLIVGPHDTLNIGAFKDDKLLGFCFGGIFRGALSGFLRKNRNYLIKQILTRPWLLFNPLIRDRIVSTIKLRVRWSLPRQPSATSPQIKQVTENDRAFGILSIAVDPEFHGNGVAQDLMNYSERVASDKGFNSMGLSVHSTNGRAIRFYEKMGWQRSTDNDVWDGRMTKLIDSI